MENNISSNSDFMSFFFLAFAQQKDEIKKLKELAPAKDYISAHMNVEKPYEILGGPIEIEISQNSGGVFVALSDSRELDPTVFGTPVYLSF